MKTPTDSHDPQLPDNSVNEPDSSKKDGWLARLIRRATGWYEYAIGGVWSDQRRNWRVNIVKTLNLSVRSFLNADLQNRAAALTYQTLLAIVPALALVFAICRGFGFQNLVQTQLLQAMPAQQKALETALKFVDSYLATSSEGIFVGIGILFLLWTLISLISSVEESFDKIWGLAQGRTLWRKVTDYTAILLILPVLMICASGITVFMSTTIQDALPFEFLTPVVSTLLDICSLLLVWLFFAGTYMLIPNTKVKFKNAFISGIIAGTGFLILQWLFVNGQIYVTRYNAIYGSFAFLPLLLIWMQLVWLITLSGAVYCYSSQNIFEFSFSNEIARISEDYRWRIMLTVMTITVNRFVKGEPPLTDREISNQYGLPISLVSASVNHLLEEGLLLRVVEKSPDNGYGVTPALDPSTLTLGLVLRRLGNHGAKGFIPGFDNRYRSINGALDHIEEGALERADKILLTSLEIPTAK